MEDLGCAVATVLTVLATIAVSAIVIVAVGFLLGIGIHIAEFIL